MDQEIDEETMPKQFLCPIFLQIMKDPVITADGFTFERRAIQQWFGKGKNTNPLTNANLPNQDLRPNRALRNVIEQHNVRLREIQRQAENNAMQIIKNCNKSLSEVLPVLINQLGLVDLDKVIIMAQQNTRLRNSMIKTQQNFTSIDKLCSNKSNCNGCQSLVSSIKSYKSFINGDVSEIIKAPSVIGNCKIQATPDVIQYILLNNDHVKGIDFKRLKKGEIKKYQLKQYMLYRMTIDEILKIIRVKRNIHIKDFMRAWICKMSLNELYDHISSEAERITGPYIKKVRACGKDVNHKSKLSDLNLKQGEYLLIQHGPGEQYVFRQQQAKCDFCYKVLKIQTMCDCKRTMYCSQQCKEKDKGFHQRTCPLREGSRGEIPV